jgi:transposase
MIGLNEHQRFYFYTHVCDMRKGIHGLSGIVRSQMELDPEDNSVYIFVNRPRNTMKILVWDKDGFLMYYKRLVKGTFDIPAVNESNTIEVEYVILQYIFRGVRWDKIELKKRYKRS